LGEDFRLAKVMIKAGLELRTLDDLTVEHRESKTYGKAVSWMWESGVDATSLLFEFRSVRLPDLAWLAWLLGILLAVVASAVGVVSFWLSFCFAAALTLIVDVLFINSRFTPRSRPLRFLAALVISPPMMLAYLLGRTTGVVERPFLLHNVRKRQIL
jgi:hypothetical protein